MGILARNGLKGGCYLSCYQKLVKLVLLERKFKNFTKPRDLTMVTFSGCKKWESWLEMG